MQISFPCLCGVGRPNCLGGNDQLVQASLGSASSRSRKSRPPDWRLPILALLASPCAEALRYFEEQ